MQKGIVRARKIPTEKNPYHFNVAWKFHIIREMKKYGVEIMAGTDTPLGCFTPGFSLHKELETLVEAGLTPLEALDSATVKPAQFFGVENQLGNIEVGMLADLVLLSKNPLKDIGNTRSIEMVVKEGELYDAQALDNVLLSLEQRVSE